MNCWLFLLPFISACLGYFINSLGIKMLFHPRLPKKILGITVQGVFPKRQNQFAEKFTKILCSEFVSFNEIEEKITQPKNVEKLMPFVEQHIDTFLRIKLSKEMPMISMFIGESTIQQLKKVFIVELEELFPILIKTYLQNLQKGLNLEEIISTKIMNFSSAKLESLLYSTLKKEFYLIKIIGGVFGFIIGLLQVLITIICQP